MSGTTIHVDVLLHYNMATAGFEKLYFHIKVLYSLFSVLALMIILGLFVIRQELSVVKIADDNKAKWLHWQESGNYLNSILSEKNSDVPMRQRREIYSPTRTHVQRRNIPPELQVCTCMQKNKLHKMDTIKSLHKMTHTRNIQNNN